MQKLRNSHLNFEGEVLFHVLDDHDQVGQLDAEGLPGVGRASDVSRAHVCAHHFQNKALDVCIRDAFDMTIPDLKDLSIKSLFKRMRTE